MNIHLTPSLVLTNERAESRYGIPVLVNRQDDATAYGPADIIEAYHQIHPAAHVVVRFAKILEENGKLSDEERQAIRNYLSQWPDGPQLSE